MTFTFASGFVVGAFMVGAVASLLLPTGVFISLAIWLTRSSRRFSEPGRPAAGRDSGGYARADVGPIGDGPPAQAPPAQAPPAQPAPGPARRDPA